MDTSSLLQAELKVRLYETKSVYGLRSTVYGQAGLQPAVCGLRGTETEISCRVQWES